MMNVLLTLHPVEDSVKGTSPKWIAESAEESGGQRIIIILIIIIQGWNSPKWTNRENLSG